MVELAREIEETKKRGGKAKKKVADRGKRVVKGFR